MAMLDTLTLRVTDPQAQGRFYRNALGMSDRGDGRLGYATPEAALRFLKADEPYEPQRSDLYWKIAISVPDIDLACRQLAARGVAVTTPRQFLDVGYLASLTDPEGFTIELIDHWFEGRRPAGEQDTQRLGGGPHLNLVTLRTADIAGIERSLLNWGMTSLSVQPVLPYGFTLYFYAFTDERPPKAALTAIENRTWTYQRPYTVLEIQHVHGLGSETRPADKAGGYGGLTVCSERPLDPCSQLGITMVRSPPPRLYDVRADLA